MKKANPMEPFELRFERDGGDRLVAGPAGALLRLTSREFSSFRAGRVREGTPLFDRLAAAGLLRGRLDLDGLIAGLSGLGVGGAPGPGLHILVLTLSCNHACVYCRAAVGGHGRERMSLAVARASVETAFRSPNRRIAVEFQGGEALLNWPVLKGAVAHAKKLNRAAGKELSLSVVTNLSLMDEEKFGWLSKEGVSVCTSLDGPADLHDSNRRWSGGSSHAKAAYWLKRFRSAAAGGGVRDALPSALMTTTRQSLGRARDIVDEYRALGLGGIFLRPLSPVGYAAAAWPRIGYPPEAFLKFYREAIGRVMEINLSGELFVERWAALLAAKILRGEDPNYLDLRSPCGAATGQLAYNWNGDVYTCDEGRMMAACGDAFFRLGNVRRDSYETLLSAPAARVCAMASCLENQPACARCAFKSFCGVCPVHNYSEQGSPWGSVPAGSWCALHKGLFRIVFGLLEKKSARRVIESWLEGSR